MISVAFAFFIASFFGSFVHTEMGNMYASMNVTTHDVPTYLHAIAATDAKCEALPWTQHLAISDCKSKVLFLRFSLFFVEIGQTLKFLIAMNLKAVGMFNDAFWRHVLA